MLKAIYLDMDGVLVDLVRHTYRQIMPLDLVNKAHDMTIAWDSMHGVISELTGKPFTEKDLFDLWADGGQEFWAEAPWLPHGRALYDLCNSYAPVVLMSTPTREPSCAAGKMQWISENMPAEQIRRYALSPCKHHMAHPGALLVDDGEHNINAFLEHDGNAFMWPGPWNANGKQGMTPYEALGRLETMLDSLSS